MDGRTAGWASEGSHGHSLEPSLLPTLLGLHITAWDALRLFPCLLWSLLAIVCAVVFLQYPIVHGRPAHLLPMLGALQSAMPSFMCSCLILMYHRERILLFGLPRETAKSFSGFYCILSALGCLVYLTLLMTTVFVFQVDRTEEPAYFFLSSSWLLVTILWFVLQACLKPSRKQIEQLIHHYESAHPSSCLPAAAARAAAAAAAPVAVGLPLVAVGAAQDALAADASRNPRSQPVVIGQIRS